MFLKSARYPQEALMEETSLEKKKDKRKNTDI
jgi:hypothetical protein